MANRFQILREAVEKQRTARQEAETLRRELDTDQPITIGKGSAAIDALDEFLANG